MKMSHCILLLLSIFASLLGSTAHLAYATVDDGSATIRLASPKHSCEGVTEIPRNECEALVELYTVTGGDGWKQKGGWLSNNTPCSWFGVYCWNNRVRGLGLEGNGLGGFLPPALGVLSDLRWLNLGYNDLGGPIPDEYRAFTLLQRLDVSGNKLQGPLPSWLGELQQLFELSLDYFPINGRIPDWLRNLNRLESLHMSGCGLTGEIPGWLGSMPNLHNLALSSNYLTGPVPAELGNLSSLFTLYLGNNQLSGSIPPELGRMSDLLYLVLAMNRFTGTIPPELGALPRLLGLNINSNELTGPLPQSLTALNLEGFYFDQTDLCEPQDQAIQNWLTGIANLRSTGIKCGAANVAGSLWQDRDLDGAMDRGEPPLAGAAVTLMPQPALLASATGGRRVFSGADGTYRFTNVSGGIYSISISVPAGYLPTGPSKVTVTVPAAGEETVPPIGFVDTWHHLYLPSLRR